MATKGDPARDRLKDDLWAEGVSDDLAEQWIARWEEEAAPRDVPRDASYWANARAWIDRERGAS